MERSSCNALVGVAALMALSACSLEEVTKTPTPSVAGLRFINALPDTSGAFGLDFRPIDIVENSAQFRVPFRNAPTTAGGVTGLSAVQYKAAQSGSRRFVVFLDDTIQAIASTKLKDSTLTLTPGSNYTAILWGQARGGQAQLRVFEETVADPGSSKVALRVINTSGIPIDVRVFPTGGTVPANPTWSNVGGLAVSTFVTADTGSITYNVRTAGTSTSVFADMVALLGAPATSSAGAGGKLDIEALPGTRVGGSAVTLVVFPRSTAGARTPQTAPFQVPAGGFIWDRRPARSF